MTGRLSAAPTTTLLGPPSIVTRPLPIDIFYDRQKRDFVGLVQGPDGKMWFLERALQRIANITPQGLVTEFQIPYKDIEPGGPDQPAVGPDGALWFLYTTRDEPPRFWLGHMTIAGVFSRASAFGVVGIINVPGGTPWSWNGDPQSPDNEHLGVLSLDGRIRRVSRDRTGGLGCADRNTAVWAQLNSDLYRITLSSTKAYRDIFQESDQFNECAVGPDGSVWWAGAHPAQVVRVTAAGRVTRYPLPPAGDGARFDGDVVSIATGPDGAMWIAADDPNSLARISMSGAITTYKLPIKSSGEIFVAQGPGGTLWLLAHDFIARVRLSAAR